MLVIRLNCYLIILRLFFSVGDNSGVDFNGCDVSAECENEGLCSVNFNSSAIARVIRKLKT